MISQTIIEAQGRSSNLPERILRVLSRQPRSVTQLKDDLGVSVGDTLKYHLKKLESAGKVVQLGTMPSGKQGQAPSAVYGLPGQSMLSAEVVKTTDQKVLEILAQAGPQLVETLAEEIGLSRDAIVDALQKLHESGQVIYFDREVEFYARSKGEVRRYWALPSQSPEDVKLPSDAPAIESDTDRVREWLLSYLGEKGPQKFTTILRDRPALLEATESMVRYALDKCQEEGKVVPYKYTRQQIKKGSRVYWGLPGQSLPSIPTSPRSVRTISVNDIEKSVFKYLRNSQYEIPEESLLSDLAVKIPQRRVLTALASLKGKELVQQIQRSRGGEVRMYWTATDKGRTFQG